MLYMLHMVSHWSSFPFVFWFLLQYNFSPNVSRDSLTWYSNRIILQDPPRTSIVPTKQEVYRSRQRFSPPASTILVTTQTWSRKIPNLPYCSLLFVSASSCCCNISTTNKTKQVDTCCVVFLPAHLLDLEFFQKSASFSVDAPSLLGRLCTIDAYSRLTIVLWRLLSFETRSPNTILRRFASH